MKFLSGVFMNFLLRMIIGILLIILLNQAFEDKEIDVSVGINPVTAVTAGVLGVPGVCMLYGMVLY